MQRHALLFSLPLAVAAVVLGYVLRGTPGLVGALLGAVLGLAAGLGTTLVMRGTARPPPAGVASGASAPPPHLAGGCDDRRNDLARGQDPAADAVPRRLPGHDPVRQPGLRVHAARGHQIGSGQ